jgi:hypothetical protein
MAMKIIGESPRRGDPSGSRASSRRIGGAREFTTFALLAFCLAATVAIAFGHRHSNVHGAKMQAATPAHRAVAPKPNPQSRPAVASRQERTSHEQTSQKQTSQKQTSREQTSQVLTSDDYSAWIASTAGNFGNSAQNAGNVVMQFVVDLVWDPVFGLSNRIVGYVSDSWVNPVTGDRIIFNAAPGASHLAVSILALTMVGIMMLALAGPIYSSWKSWRLSRAHGFRNYPHEN